MRLPATRPLAWHRRSAVRDDRGAAWPLAVVALWIVMLAALTALDSGAALLAQQQAQDELDSATRIAVGRALDTEAMLESGVINVSLDEATLVLQTVLLSRPHGGWSVETARIEETATGHRAIATLKRTTSLTPWAARSFTVSTSARWEESP